MVLHTTCCLVYGHNMLPSVWSQHVVYGHNMLPSVWSQHVA